MKNTFLIAEAGVNHNGDFNIAKQLVDIAKQAGADAVKFQTFSAEKLVTKNAAKAQYQMLSDGAGDSQFEMLKRLQLSRDAFVKLNEYCKQKEITFLSTAFDIESVDLLEDLGVIMHKIPSGEVTNLPLLLKLASTHKPLILSSGMCTMKEIKDCVEILSQNGAGKLTILHCNTEYPTPFQDVNLRAMLTIGREIGVDIGYSDHTTGIEVPIAAVALGAKVIEKHFTIDKKMEGPDHSASLEPHELTAMVSAIRNIETALGTEKKRPSPSEEKNMAIARKSIVTAAKIRKGEVFSENNITVKRPGTGISPMKWFEILGKPSSRDYEEDELIVL